MQLAEYNLYTDSVKDIILFIGYVWYEALKALEFEFPKNFL